MTICITGITGSMIALPVQAIIPHSSTDSSLLRIQRSVQVIGGANQAQVCEGLREVPQLLGIESEMISVAEGFLEIEPRQVMSPRIALARRTRL
jgi:hypothetical protein